MTWPQVRLGDVAEFVNGFAFKPSDWGEEGFPIIRIQNLTDKSKPFNRTGRPVNAKLVVSPGDLLVSWSATLGVFVWDRPEPGVLNQHIFRVIPRNDVVDARYLRHLLESALDEMGRHLHGATMQHVNRAEFLGTAIPLPPLPEQRRIAAIFDQADELRAKRNQVGHLLDEVAATSLLRLDAQGMPAGTVPLGDLTEVVSGITKGRRTLEPVREVPYLTVANVQDRRLNLSSVKTIEATDREITKFILEEEDLLLTEGGDPDKLGRGGLWRSELHEAIHQNHVFRVRVRDRTKLDPVYLNWHLSSRYGRDYFLRSAKQTTGIATINSSQLRAFPVVLPPLEIQLEFRSTVEQVQSQQQANFRQRARLDELFASLQHRAFEGAL